MRKTEITSPWIVEDTNRACKDRRGVIRTATTRSPRRAQTDRRSTIAVTARRDGQSFERSEMKIKKTPPTVNLADFREDPENVSVATDEDIERLVGKLRRNPRGLAAMRIAYVTDDPPGACTVNSGNKRLRVLTRIAKDGGIKADGAWLVSPSGDVPAEWFCDITFMTPEQRREFRLNTNISDGSFDAEKLLAQYTRDDLAALMSADAIDELCKQAEKDDPKSGQTDADSVPSAPETPVSKRGEVYICGEHRLMCGDSTSADDVARLMGGGQG